MSDHFTLFGLPRSLTVDMAALDAAYERLSLENHPDFFSTAPEAERGEAETASARINEAYRVLASEGARAAYLLRLLADGRPLDTKALPEGFLSEMFVLQEEVDDLESTAGQEERTLLRTTVQARLEHVLSERTELFEAAQKAAAHEQLQAIQSNINCAHYLQRLCNRLTEPRT